MLEDYNYILVRSDRDLSLSYLFSTYTEQTSSFTVEYKGRAYCGIRLRDETARNVALCYGWNDITVEYKEWTEKETIEEDPKPKPKATVKKKASTRKKAVKK